MRFLDDDVDLDLYLAGTFEQYQSPPEDMPTADGNVDPGASLLQQLLGHVGLVDGFAPACVSDFVPFPFAMNQLGIYRRQKDAKKPIDLICGPLVVTCLTRGMGGRDYGLQIVARALDGRLVRMNLPAKKLHGDPADLTKGLADAGVRIVPKQEKSLLEFLDAARAAAAIRPWMTAQPRLGWADGDKMEFVFPEAVMGAQDSVFQPERANRMAESCVVQGELADWQAAVATLTYESDIATFSLCAGLAGALVGPAGTDCFGFHLHGLTSRGKTSTAQAAASIWGNGNDPTSDSRSFCRKWTATTNALEAMAEEHTDMVLCMDEIGSYRNADDLGRAVYTLAGGRGAERLNANGERRAVREWRTVILSSGEISIADLMRQHGKQQRGGQALRVLDIPFPREGLFPGRDDAAAVVNRLKEGAGGYHGIAGRAFVRMLIEKYGRHAVAKSDLRQRMRAIATGLAVGTAAEVARAAERFALVIVAGELAVSAGILTCTVERVHDAAQAVWKLWRDGVPHLDDGIHAIRRIADFITSHPGQFPKVDDVDKLPNTVAGYVKPDGKNSLHLLTESGFLSAIGDIAKDVALSALREAGLLFTNEKDRYVSKHHIASAGIDRPSFYAVRSSILTTSGDGSVPLVPSVPQGNGTFAVLGGPEDAPF